MDTKEAQKFLNELDIDAAIGAFTVLIDKTQACEDYLGRGMARCFYPVKRGEPYTGAIEDLNTAHVLNPTKIDILYYRAYAYYTNKLYHQAIEDCNTAITAITTIGATGSAADTAPFYELTGHSYFALKKYKDAKENYEKAIKGFLGADMLVSSSLLEKYREACEKDKN